MKKNRLQITDYRLLNIQESVFRNQSSKSSGAGFTLVELIVTIAIVATLIIGAIATLNPGKQIERARDSQRQQNLSQIKSALDLYYQDHNCYPGNTSTFATALETGAEWKEGNTVYMKKVPLDPTTHEKYDYVADTGNCPQWNSIFAKLSEAPKRGTVACPLPSTCVPAGVSTDWACTISGSATTSSACSVLASATVITPTPTVAPTAGGGGFFPTATPTIHSGSSSATPTPTTAPAQSTNPVAFYVAMPTTDFPQFYQGSIDPLAQTYGNIQVLNIDAFVNSGTVTSVDAVVRTDTKTQVYHMTKTTSHALVAPITDDATWSTSWTVNDTTNLTFRATFTGHDSNGNTSNFSVILN